jgi:hypothetical protein
MAIRPAPRAEPYVSTATTKLPTTNEIQGPRLTMMARSAKKPVKSAAVSQKMGVARNDRVLETMNSLG